MRQRKTGIIAVLFLLAGCGSEQPARAPERTQPAPQPQTRDADINFDAMMGVARARNSGVICVAIPLALDQGDALTLVTVPVAPAKVDSTPEEYSSVVAVRVTGGRTPDCSPEAVGTGLRLPGDSVYTVRPDRDTVRKSAVYFAVAHPFRQFFRVGHTAGARIDGLGDVLNFRICASHEGMHLTAWNGSALTGRRVWHRYYYLGGDRTPSCVEKDTG